MSKKPDKKTLSNIVEGILFVAGNGVALKDIADKLEVKVDDIKSAIEVLKEKYDEDNGINIILYKDKAQLTSNPKYSEEISTVLNPIKEKALTKAALETVAIVAYQQPITKLEIEQVRGVSSDYAIQLLLTHNLIEVVGRKDAVGKPLLFGTTDEFLKRFEIESLENLPKYEELLEQIAVIKDDSNSLYREFEVLPLEEDDKIIVESMKDSDDKTDEKFEEDLKRLKEATDNADKILSNSQVVNE